MPEIVKSQRTQEWFMARAGRITASIAADCLGLGLNSRASAWRTILMTEPDKDSPAKFWGREHEDEARAEYEIQSGAFVNTTGFWVHPSLDWLGASPDGLIGDEGILEILCPKAPRQSVPLYKRIQALTQLIVTERQWCDFWAWHPDGCWGQRIYRSGLDGLLRRLTEFYTNYVLKGVEPERKKPRRKRT